MMAERIDTVVIGGGQAGLTMSYLLSRQGAVGGPRAANHGAGSKSVKGARSGRRPA